MRFQPCFQAENEDFSHWPHLFAVWDILWHVAAMTDFMIREARTDDDYYRAYPVIKQLLPNLDMQLYTNRAFIARATGYRMFIALLGDEVIGVLGIVSNYNLHDGFSMFLEHVIVDKEHRAKGYGAQLVAFAEARAREEGCKIIELDADYDAEPAMKMYEKNGFKRFGYCYEKKLESE